MLFAAAQLSDDDVISFLSQLRSMPADELLDSVQAEREHLGIRSAKSERVLMPSHGPQVRPEAGISHDAVLQIQRLLTDEAGLSKTRAAGALTQALMTRHPSARVPPFSAKEGFAKWVRHLGEDFALGEILHLAAKIRNDFVHSTSDDDWLQKRIIP